MDFFAGELAQKAGDERFGLPRGRAVADGDGRDAMAPDHPQHGGLGKRALLFVDGQGEVGHARLQQAAVRIHGGQLAAGTVAGVYAQRGAALDGRLHQKAAEVLGKHVQRAFLRTIQHLRAQLPFHGRGDQALPCVLRCQCELARAFPLRMDKAAF